MEEGLKVRKSDFTLRGVRRAHEDTVSNPGQKRQLSSPSSLRRKTGRWEDEGCSWGETETMEGRRQSGWIRDGGVRGKV